MTTAEAKQASIVDRIDRALASILEDGLKPVSIFLTPGDRQQLDRYATRVWRSQTGSTAFIYPCSYNDVPIVSEKLAGDVEQVPVRQDWNGRRRPSTVYASTGVPYRLDMP